MKYQDFLGKDDYLAFIDYICAHPNLVFSQTELASQLNCSRTFVRRAVRRAMKTGIINVAHEHRRFIFYALDKDSPAYRFYACRID